MKGLNVAFEQDFWNTSKMISALLRHRVHLPSVIGIIDGLVLDVNNNNSMFGTWKSGVKRTIKKYINSIVTAEESCPNCGAVAPELAYEQGCITCKNCGWSKCSD